MNFVIKFVVARVHDDVGEKYVEREEELSACCIPNFCVSKSSPVGFEKIFYSFERSRECESSDKENYQKYERSNSGDVAELPRSSNALEENEEHNCPSEN